MAHLDTPAVRLVPQALALRPSVRTAFPATTAQGRPDELMIDWGDLPRGSRATLYWPGTPAIDVVRLGALLYADNPLEVADPHTVRLIVDARLSFVPIPFGEGEMLAGLFTIELPQGLRRGQAFKVVVRRMSAHRAGKLEAAQGGKAPLTEAWRHVVGTFQTTIPIRAADHVLWREEDALAILKWRLERTPKSNRWRQVLERFVECTAARVDGFGGKAAAIRASPQGAAPAGDHDRARVFTGRVIEVLFDGVGAFEGFVLETEAGRHRFASREPGVGDLASRVLRDDLVLSVVMDDEPPRIRELIVRN